MSDTPSESASEQPLQRAIDNLVRLDSALQDLVPSLDKHHIRPTTDLIALVDHIHNDAITVHQQNKAVRWQLEQLQNIINSSARITSSLQLDQVLELVLDSVIKLTGAKRAHLMLYERDKERLVIRKSLNWDNPTNPQQDDSFSRSVIEAALEKGEPVVSVDARTDRRFKAAASVMMHGLRAVVCIPLMLDGRVIGALYSDDRIRQALFAPEMIPILSTFGAQAAIAIEKARLHEEELQKQRIEEELNVGKRIQLSLLPASCPSINGWNFAALYRAARVVGGDFYDFFQLPDQRLGIVVADVADKGIPAAIFMAVSRTTIRAAALSGRIPSEALSRANQIILEDNRADLFLTVFYAVLDPADGRIVYANGGHNHPFIWRASDYTLEALHAPGIILGTFPNIHLENRETVIEAGDVVVFYTDGLTEAMDNTGQEFGEKRLQEAVAANAEQSAGAILDTIVDSVNQFTGDAPQSDDLTIVVVKRH